MTTSDAASGTRSVNALRRGLDVLALIQRSSAISFTELREETGLPKATLARLLKTLVESGWVKRHAREGEGHGRYVCETSPSLAPRLRGERERLATVAQPVRARLQREIPWPIDLGVREGTSMVIVDAPGSVVLALAANYRLLGFRPPMLRSSLGRCYLAFCPPQEREELLLRLSHSTDELDRAALRGGGIERMVKEVQARGHALRDPSHTALDSPERYGALAVPVFCGERLVACLSVSWLLQVTSTTEMVRLHLARLQTAARLIGRRLVADLSDAPPPRMGRVRAG